MLILTSYPELENDRWTVEMSFIFNVNFYNQIKSVCLYIFSFFLLAPVSHFAFKLICNFPKGHF